MFKKSRYRIMMLTVLVLAVLLAGTVCVIYFSTYRQIRSRNKDMLQVYSDAYLQNGKPDAEGTAPADLPEIPSAGAEAGNPPDDGDRPLKLLVPLTGTGRLYDATTFYSVAFYKNSETPEITNDAPSPYSDEQLTEMAREILSKGPGYGSGNGVAWLLTETEELSLVAIMDNTVIDESTRTLIQSTLVFGGIGLAAVILLSWFFSGLIIRPLETSYLKQRQFISDAGHELKTPISTVNANAELLSREIGSNSWLDNIRYENGRMEGIVHQLLDLARLENVELPKEDLDFGKLVLSGILPFEGPAFESGVLMEYDVPEGIHVNGNAAQLEQLVSILTDNGIRHSAKGSTLSIKVAAAHRKVLFTVANHGGTIPPEKLPLIFERFYRVDDSRQEDSGNYGLGLSIAKAIVTAHQGKIEAESKDGLTVFSVTLPASQQYI